MQIDLDWGYYTFAEVLPTSEGGKKLKRNIFALFFSYKQRQPVGNRQQLLPWAAFFACNPGAGANVCTFAPALGVLCALTSLFVSSGVKISGLMDSWGVFFRIIIHLLQKL